MKKFILLFFLMMLSSCYFNYFIDRNDYTDEEFNLLIQNVNNSVMDWVSERQSSLLDENMKRGCVEIDPGICDFEKEDNLVFSLSKVVAIFPVYMSETSSKIDHFLVVVSNDNGTQGMYISYSDHFKAYYEPMYENLSDYYFNEETKGELNRVVYGDYVHGGWYWSLNITVNDSTENIQVYDIVGFNQGLFNITEYNENLLVE